MRTALLLFAVYKEGVGSPGHKENLVGGIALRNSHETPASPMGMPQFHIGVPNFDPALLLSLAPC